MVCPGRVRWSAPLILLLVIGGTQAADGRKIKAEVVVPSTSSR